MITERNPNGVQKKTWISYLVVRKTTFCITYVRLDGHGSLVMTDLGDDVIIHVG